MNQPIEQSSYSNPAYYRHVDGGIYRFFGFAEHSEGQGPHAVYEHVWPYDLFPCVRPADLWRKNFKPITDAEALAAMQGNREEARAAVAAAKAARRKDKQAV